MKESNYEFTTGSLCAGIGGFDLGFEKAGWKTSWQIELDDSNRAVLADRFPKAQQFKDLNQWRSYPLSPVSCILFGFPCQDISVAGNARKDKSATGLKGARSGLFYVGLQIIEKLKPAWLVIENVPALLHSNDSADIEIIIQELAKRDYLGFARVLNAQYFGVPQNRRRIFLVAGLGRYPAMEFLADAAPVDAIPSSLGSICFARQADAWAGHTLTATDAACRIGLGGEVLVAEEDGWYQMVKRRRASRLHGLPAGLDALNLAEAYGAGNAVCPPVAEWIAHILKRS